MPTTPEAAPLLGSHSLQSALKSTAPHNSLVGGNTESTATALNGRTGRQVTFNPDVSAVVTSTVHSGHIATTTTSTNPTAPAPSSSSGGSLSSSPSSSSSLSPASARLQSTLAKQGQQTSSTSPASGIAALRTKIRRRYSQSTEGMASLSSSFPPMSVNPQAPKIGPQRTTKVTGKLKILPIPIQLDDSDEESGRDVYVQYTKIKDPTARHDAARLGKDDRTRLPRVTAYCMAEKYRLEDVMRYFQSKGRKARKANPKLIDECIYTPYSYSKHLPTRLTTTTMMTTTHEPSASFSPSQAHAQFESRTEMIPESDTKSNTLLVLDSEAETSPRIDLHSSLISTHNSQQEHIDTFKRDLEAGGSYHDDATVTGRPERQFGIDNEPRYVDELETDNNGHYVEQGSQSHLDCPEEQVHQEQHDQHRDEQEQQQHRGSEIDIEVHVPEVFLFEYGTVVLWGMSEKEERTFLAEMARFEVDTLPREKVQVEDFNFYYTREYQARIYNDFISLRDKGNYKMKLAVSHALSQSVKTSLYEEMVEDTIIESKDLPNEIAEKGKVKMTKSQIHMFIGRLFLLRINIHLQGSVLDAPELMWTEPQLDPVYQAVRSYLEMDERVNLLTDRLTVVGDLLSVLRDQLSHSHDEYLEWIVIILIAAEIMVAAINIIVDIYADAH